MAIEILILSGARRGERLMLNAVQFCAGCDPECEIRFDPELDPGRAVGRRCYDLRTMVGTLARAVAGDSGSTNRRQRGQCVFARAT